MIERRAYVEAALSRDDEELALSDLERMQEIAELHQLRNRATTRRRPRFLYDDRGMLAH